MKVEQIKKENGKANFKVVVESEKFNEANQRAYLKNRGKIAIPGFRKGKAPLKIIELNYGEGIFYEDAINDLLPEAYEFGLEELKLDPIDQPAVDIDGEVGKNKELIFLFDVELRPEIELPEIKDIELDILKREVQEDEINAVIEKERDSNARLISVEDEILDGDTVNIDFEGSVDGEVFEGGQAEGYDLVIGSKTFIPGFEEQMIGKKNEDAFDVNVTFPEDYEPSLSGKDAVFKVKVNAVKRKELPELDDEFAMDVSEFDTLEEYKNSIREKLEKNNENAVKNERANLAIEKLIEMAEISAPESMIKHQLEHEVREFEQRIRQMGLDRETYLKITNGNMEDLEAQLKPNAEARVKGDLVVDALIKAGDYNVSEEEIEKELEEIAEEYGQNDESKKEFIEGLRESNALDFVKENIIKRKALEDVVLKFTYNEMSKEDYDKKYNTVAEENTEEAEVAETVVEETEE